VLEHALQYLKDGWSIIPVDKSKKPLIPWKEFQDRKPTTTEVRTWWSKWPSANIGAVTGKISGVVVVDVDSAEGQSNVELVMGDQIEGIPYVETGGGGRHYYFKHPGTHSISNAVSMLPGVDFRADGGYVVLPPSMHNSGKPYEWRNSDFPIERHVPSSIININAKKEKSQIDWEGDITEGARDSELTRRVGKLVQMGMSEKDITPMMIAWSNNHCKPPLDPRQIDKIVKSICGRENSKKPENQPPKSFETLSFMDTLNKHGLVETSWQITDWLPASTVGLFVAPPASYKTWLFLHIAYCVSTGKKLFDKFEVQNPGPVLIVQQEDPIPLLMARLCTIMNMGETKEKDGVHRVPMPPIPPPVYFHTERLLNFQDKKSVEGLEAAVERIRPKLVLIDPLYSVVGMKDFMAEGAQDMMCLKTLRDKYRTSFLIAHHTVKRSGSDTGRENLWGSQFLNAWLETGWQLRKSDDDENSVILRRHFKSSPPIQPVRLKMNITDYHFNVEIDDSAKGVSIVAKDQISELIATNKISSQRDIVKAIPGMSLTTVNRILKELGVEKDGEGNYTF